MRPHDLARRLLRLEGAMPPPPEPPAMDPRIAYAVLAAADATCPDWRAGDPPAGPDYDEAAGRTLRRLEEAEAAGRLDEELTAFYAEHGQVYDPTPHPPHWSERAAEPRGDRR